MECAHLYGTAKFRYEYHYDLQGRLLRENAVVNSGEHLTIADNRYDELGRLVNDSRTGAAALNTTYSYNVRSQLTGISSPIFSENYIIIAILMSQSHLIMATFLLIAGRLHRTRKATPTNMTSYQDSPRRSIIAVLLHQINIPQTMIMTVWEIFSHYSVTDC